MIAAALLVALLAAPAQTGAPRSYLARPLYLQEEPPPCRALARILVRARTDVPGAPPGAPGKPLRAREEGLRRALALRAELEAGTPFAELAARASEEARGRHGGVLGTFAPGALRDDVEAFLWAAQPGEVSPPLEGPEGFELVQRVERLAGCRAIVLRGRDAAAHERAAALLARARAGEAFGTLAREASDDPLSAARGGAYAVFERGPQDRLLKEATFRAAPGELFGPIEAALGLVVGQRVAPEELPADLFPEPWIRARAIFVAHKDVEGPRALTERTQEEARLLAQELGQRLRAGADMAELARAHDDDQGGRARAGDLGWLRRDAPGLSRALDPLFLVEPGTLLDPLPVEAGWLLLRRER